MGLIADTSAWIEYLRRTGSPTHRHLARLVGDDPRNVVVPGPVRFEILIGARNKADARKLGTMLSACTTAPIIDPQDYGSAASIRRALGRRGRAVSMPDCLIAWAAIRDDLELLHNDRDFELIAEVSPLRLADLGS